MTSLPVSTTREAQTAHKRLRHYVDRSAARGVLLASLGGVVLALASLLLGVLLLGILDAIVVLSMDARFIGLGLVVVLSLALVIVFAIRPWLVRRRVLSAAEQMEQTAGARDQPIVRSLSLREDRSDPLTAALGERAQQRAAQVAESVQPGRAYPWKSLTRQGRWLWLACVGWLVVGIVFPTQMLGVVQRALLPWIDTPAFSLTQLDPSWTPDQPKQGEDVTVKVAPEGLQADGVDLLRLDDQGNVAERITMTADGQGGFEHTLRQVDQPVTFKLEAHGRASQPYTITPEPRQAENPSSQGETTEPDASAGGTTQYDPQSVKEREAAEDWAGLRAKIGELLAELADIEALAQSIDPADAEALKALAQRISALTEQASDLADQLEAIKADLPADAAASLSAIKQALANLQSADLPTAPGSEPGTSQDQTNPPTPADWLDQAQNAAKNDQQQISQGLGRSDVPTDSGTSTGNPGDNAPNFRDPSAVGGHDEVGVNGQAGPLPAAVMQQIPPSYRPLISAYFSGKDKQPSQPTEDQP